MGVFYTLNVFIMQFYLGEHSASALLDAVLHGMDTAGHGRHVHHAPCIT